MGLRGDDGGESNSLVGLKDWTGCHADVWALEDDGARERAVMLVGRPSDLITESRQDADAWAAWQQTIATLVESLGYNAGSAALTEWQKQASEDDAVAGSLYRAVVKADLAGQVFVREAEVPEAQPTALDASTRPAFLSLPFDQAIEAFLEKRLVSPEEFRQLSDEARTLAFTATRLASTEVQERARRLITEALERGTPLSEFVQQLRSYELSLGVAPEDRGYVENVYRTNVASAYGAGRYRQITSLPVRTARPFVQYRTAGDNRVRPAHAALNGRVFRQDDPDWPRYAPPNGYQCRCVVVALREPPAGSRVTVAGELGLDEQPDEGFNAPPALDNATIEG